MWLARCCCFFFPTLLPVSTFGTWGNGRHGDSYIKVSSWSPGPLISSESLHTKKKKKIMTFFSVFLLELKEVHWCEWRKITWTSGTVCVIRIFWYVLVHYVCILDTYFVRVFYSCTSFCVALLFDLWKWTAVEITSLFIAVQLITVCVCRKLAQHHSFSFSADLHTQCWLSCSHSRESLSLSFSVLPYVPHSSPPSSRLLHFISPQEKPILC